MAHFYSVIQGNRGKATRCGSKSSGITATAASWGGAITVYVANDENGNDIFEVYLRPWHNSAGHQHLLASGRLDSSLQPKSARITV